MKRLLIALFSLGFSFNAFAIDSYDPVKNELTIPKVQVGSTFYRDVKIKVGIIVSLDIVKATETFDVYDAVKNQLLIPSVLVGSTTYKNVVITVGDILEVGGIMDVAAINNSSSVAVTTILTVN
jgi:kexin